MRLLTGGYGVHNALEGPLALLALPRVPVLVYPVPWVLVLVYPLPLVLLHIHRVRRPRRSQ